jgi:hypothetical protein
MKPRDSLVFCPEKGDCFAACVASILGLEMDEVPNFMEHPDRGWWIMSTAFKRLEALTDQLCDEAAAAGYAVLVVRYRVVEMGDLVEARYADDAVARHDAIERVLAGSPYAPGSEPRCPHCGRLLDVVEGRHYCEDCQAHVTPR